MIKISKLTASNNLIKFNKFINYSTLSSDPIKINNKKIFISNLTNPYWNLSIEEWLFRKNKDISHIGYFYRNEPCVVIGRNQNPFKECNLEQMATDNITLVRRNSGGGAVYHDFGNSNYCIMVPREEFKRETNSQLVSDALNKLGCPTYLTPRNDIAVSGSKISGSAYKIAGDKAYHHGTMLLGSDLTKLMKYLTTNRINMTVSKGIESVRSTVVNLNTFNPNLDHKLFWESISKSFDNHYLPSHIAEIEFLDEEFCKNNEFIVENYNKLKSWYWTYGQTPEFKQRINLKVKNSDKLELNLICKNSIIKEFKIINEDDNTNEHFNNILVSINTHLKGTKYDPLNLKYQLNAKVLNDPIFEKPDSYSGNPLEWIDLIRQIVYQL